MLKITDNSKQVKKIDQIAKVGLSPITLKYTAKDGYILPADTTKTTDNVSVTNCESFAWKRNTDDITGEMTITPLANSENIGITLKGDDSIPYNQPQNESLTGNIYSFDEVTYPRRAHSYKITYKIKTTDNSSQAVELDTLNRITLIGNNCTFNLCKKVGPPAYSEIQYVDIENGLTEYNNYFLSNKGNVILKVVPSSYQWCPPKVLSESISTGITVNEPLDVYHIELSGLKNPIMNENIACVSGPEIYLKGVISSDVNQDIPCHFSFKSTKIEDRIGYVTAEGKVFIKNQISESDPRNLYYPGHTKIYLTRNTEVPTGGLVIADITYYNKETGTSTTKTIKQPNSSNVTIDLRTTLDSSISDEDFKKYRITITMYAFSAN